LFNSGGIPQHFLVLKALFNFFHLIQKLTPAQALEKAKHYCAYQERSHYETAAKLYNYGLYKTEAEKILSQLIEEGYLNEERYAIHFAGGKFRMKKWGKVKIQYYLKQKKVSPYSIRIALKEIDEEEYAATLQQLAIDKWNSLKTEPHFGRIAKTTHYLLQRGFEQELISKVIASLEKT
jgi:regulatory protein